MHGYFRGKRYLFREVKRFQSALIHVMAPGGTPLYDVNGDVQPDRVWF